MIKYRLILLSSFFMFTVISCKKKSAAPQPTVTPITTNSPGNYGTLQTMLIQSYQGNVYAGTDSTATASFFATPVTTGINTVVNAGAVSFNATVFSNSSNQYRDSTDLLNIHTPNSVWNVTGSGNVPAFSYTCTPVYPVFTGNAQLPDSISKSGSLTINVSGVSNVLNYGISVELISGSTFVSKSIAPNQTSCVFTSTELSQLTVNNDIMIIIVFSNGTQQTFGGKSYAFDNVLEHIKYGVKVIP